MEGSPSDQIKMNVDATLIFDGCWDISVVCQVNVGSEKWLSKLIPSLSLLHLELVGTKGICAA